jgi:hypothetical protein
MALITGENIPNLLGALGSLPSQEEEQEDAFAIPIYNVQTFQPEIPQEQKLQHVYGTAAMPMFEFARKVQTGEATYDPSSQFDREAADFINRTSDQELAAQGIQPSIKDVLLPIAEAGASKFISDAGAMAAAQGGTTDAFFSSLAPTAKGYISGSGSTISQAAKDIGLAANQVAVPTEHAGQLLAKLPPGVSSAPVKYNGIDYLKMDAGQVKNAEGALLAAKTPYSGTIIEGPTASPGMFESGGLFSSAPGGGFHGYMPSIGQAGATFGVGLAFNLLSGMKPKEALKRSAISTAGTVIGTAVGGPIGGFIGGTVASIAGDKTVVCTELHRQGEISDSEYRTTNYYNVMLLTPTHMKGYHFWGVPVSEKMKKGKGVKFWKAVYKQWHKHASYKLGKGKFSLSGLIVAKSLETVSLCIGKVYEATLEKRIFANG